MTIDQRLAKFIRDYLFQGYALVPLSSPDSPGCRFTCCRMWGPF